MPNGRKLRVLVGENEIRETFNRAAKRGGSIPWIVPKDAAHGDDALFLFNRSVFTARGVVLTTPTSAKLGRKDAFQAEVGELELLEHPIPLEEVAKRLQAVAKPRLRWKWLSYPRGYTTPAPEIAAALLDLVDSAVAPGRAMRSGGPGRSAARRGPHRQEELDAAVRWDALIPERHRQTAARALSRSITAAHALADTCWSVTLKPDLIRLNVGQPLALTLSRSTCDMIVMDDPALFRGLSRAGYRVGRGQTFGKAPGTVRMDFPLALLAEVHARVWQSHWHAMEIAAAKQRATSHRGYSMALVSNLRVMGFDVPDSNCPEAVALRAARGDAGAQLPDVEPFAPRNADDARRRVLASIVARRGQGAFRDAVLRAYDFSCAISGCSVLDVLEAAHVLPYRGDHTNHIQNGILLRSDLHVLFDVGLLHFDGSWRTRLDRSLKGSAYWEFEGRPLRMPKVKSSRPSREALLLRKENRT